jgi:hypothetical protein
MPDKALAARVQEIEDRHTSEDSATDWFDKIFKLVITLAVIGTLILMMILNAKSDRNYNIGLENRAVICQEVAEQLQPGSECYVHEVRLLWDEEYARTHK